jgi:hypothetical protein
MITYKSDTKKTVVSIVNWDLYQCSDDTETSQKHIKNTSNQYQKHTNNNDNNDKNEKKDIYTPEFEEWYKSWPRSEAKADSFKNFEKRRKEHGLDFILQCSKNYIDYYSSLPKGSLAYQSNNFFGQKAYYTDYIEPKAYKPEKPISKVQQALDRMT